MSVGVALTLDRAGRPLRIDWKPPRPPGNKGKRFPPNPPKASEILHAVESLGEGAQDLRLAALIVVLWRAGLGLSEALALSQNDCSAEAGVVVVKARRKAARRSAAMDAWGFERLARWQGIRSELPSGPLFCILRGPTVGQGWGAAGARAEIVRLGQMIGAPRLRPQQLRYAHAVELMTRGVSQAEVYRQRGLGTARNNRLPAIATHVNGRHSSRALTPPGAEKVLRSAKGTHRGEAYSLVRRAAQAVDIARTHASSPIARRAWNDALRALHSAEESIMLAAREDYAASSSLPAVDPDRSAG